VSAIEFLEVAGALGAAEVERLREEMRAAAGGDAGVTGVGSEERAASSARRATRVEVSDATRAAVIGALDRLRPRIAERFGRELTGLDEPQFLRYGPGDYFVPHQDGNTPLIHDSTRFRKVSAVIFLSEQSPEGDAPGTYVGGSLVLHAPYTVSDERVPFAPAPGTLVAFPAETTHEVTPITAGERLSVVAWYRGEE
jgi:predicted 2-oxoglutarate/Fe(II)-dependent dioxygenase YbiX